MRRLWILGAVLLVFITAVDAQENVLTLVTHDSFAISESVLEQFTQETGIQVEILRVGDAGILVNQSVLSAGNALGDVLFGVDNTFLTRALDADLFIPYQSPNLEFVEGEFLLDPVFRVTPIDYGDVCLNYDVQYFGESGLPVPTSLEQLAEPEYNGLLVVENPATSSPGLAFLLATIAVFGDEDDSDGYSYLDYWQALTANDVYISDDWTNAYYGQFSGSAGSEGDRPLVVSYASSPPAEIYFATNPVAPAPTGSITTDNTCFRQIEFAGILQGTDNLDAAQQWIDFMLSPAFQADLPLNMFVFPVNTAVQLPHVFTEYAAIPEMPITMDIGEIDANRERWIQTWTETILR
jgi:thiamine transport system substrate-binding protein